MKNTIKFLSILLFAALFTVSCKKETDPADRDFFVGTYKGNVSYKDSQASVTRSDGQITVSKVGDSYNFYFGDNIPDITGVKFEKSGDNSYVSVGSGLTGISIDASNLDILVIKGDQSWSAHCTR